VVSESELAKYYQLQQVLRDVDVCAVAVIAAWWTKLWRTSRDLKDLDKMGINLETSLAVIALAPSLFGSVVTAIPSYQRRPSSPNNREENVRFPTNLHGVRRYARPTSR